MATCAWTWWRKPERNWQDLGCRHFDGENVRSRGKEMSRGKSANRMPFRPLEQSWCCVGHRGLTLPLSNRMTNRCLDFSDPSPYLYVGISVPHHWISEILTTHTRRRPATVVNYKIPFVFVSYVEPTISLDLKACPKGSCRQPDGSHGHPSSGSETRLLASPPPPTAPTTCSSRLSQTSVCVLTAFGALCQRCSIPCLVISTIIIYNY